MGKSSNTVEADDLHDTVIIRIESTHPPASPYHLQPPNTKRGVSYNEHHDNTHPTLAFVECRVGAQAEVPPAQCLTLSPVNDRSLPLIYSDRAFPCAAKRSPSLPPAIGKCKQPRTARNTIQSPAKPPQANEVIMRVAFHWTQLSLICTCLGDVFAHVVNDCFQGAVRSARVIVSPDVLPPARRILIISTSSPEIHHGLIFDRRLRAWQHAYTV